MTDTITEAGAAFGKAIADELRAIRAEMATKDDLKAFATKEDLKAFATKDDLKAFATKEDLKAYATKDDIRAIAREIIEVVNANTLALREDLNREFQNAGLPVQLKTSPRKTSR